MDAGLKIESEDASRMAGELAELTGESVEVAVTGAIRQRLEREREKAAKMGRLRQLTAEIRAHLHGPISSDHSWLYDENGLPK